MPFLNHLDFAKVQSALESGKAFFAGADQDELACAIKLMRDAKSHVASPGLRELAHEVHGCDEVEIDDEGAGTSPSDSGTWVQAWVWLDREQLVEAGLAEPDEEEGETTVAADLSGNLT
jgi:hypothetical protein